MEYSRNILFWTLHSSSWLLIAFCLLFPANIVNGADWQPVYHLGQFRISSQVSVEKVNPAVEQLEELKTTLKQQLQVEITDQTIDIVIFSSSWEYKKYLRPRVPEAVNRKALFVKAPDALWVYVICEAGWEENLRHECCHAFLNGSLPFLPIWLDEGLAEYFELPAAAQGLNHKYLSSSQWRMRLGRSIRTTELENLQSFADMRPEHYRDSWTWLYFCLQDSHGRHILQQYLQAIQQEQVPGSFFAYLQTRMPEAENKMESFIR